MELFSEAMANRLRELGEQSSTTYRQNRPYPHIVIDDFLPSEVLDAVVRDYPAPEDVPWIRFDNREEKKLAFNDVDRLPASVRDLLHAMNSPMMLAFLERMTGISDLMPDPYYVGGGLHQIRRGGQLGVHVDFNKYKRSNKTATAAGSKITVYFPGSMAFASADLTALSAAICVAFLVSSFVTSL